MMDFASAGEVVAPKDAATILVYRFRPSLEIFMVKRHSRSAFMANAMVFPGGRVDDKDLLDGWKTYADLTADEAGERLGEQDHRRALGLMVAAVRETFEEAGILLSTVGSASPTSRDQAKGRDALNDGTIDFIELLGGWNLTLGLAQLNYVSCWITPTVEKRRFNARFFSVEVPEGQNGSHDEQETTDSAWLAPERALSEYQDGRIELAPPTLRILLECCRDPSWLQRTRQPAPSPIEPQALLQNDIVHLLLPGDPSFNPPGSAVNRISRIQGKWASTGRGA